MSSYALAKSILVRVVDIFSWSICTTFFCATEYSEYYYHTILTRIVFSANKKAYKTTREFLQWSSVHLVATLYIIDI